MRSSRAHTPTINHREVEDTTRELGPERPWQRGGPDPHDLDHDLGYGLDRDRGFGLGRRVG